MNRKRKIMGMTAAVAIIVSMVMVSVPAEEENKNIDENDCGCGCNEAPTEGTPLNYDEKIKEMENLKIEFENLNKILNSKKEQFYTLCKNNDVEKAKAAWKEIKDLTREYWDKKERYIELKIMMEYVGKGRNNEMVILKNTLPKIEDIDFKISAKMNAWELIGEQIVMQKYPKMNKAIETGDTDKIKETFNEIDVLERDFWKYKEEYWGLNIIKGIKEIESKEFYILHIPGSPIIKKVNGIYLIVISKEEVSKSEMNKLEKEVEELEKK